MREKYESLSLATLKDLAKARGLRGISTLRKPELIERMLQEDAEEQNTQNTASQPEKENIRTEHWENKAREVRKPAEATVRTENHVELIRNAHRRDLVSVIRKEMQKETRNVSLIEIMNRVRNVTRKRMTDIRTGLKRALRQILHSWTVERRPMVFWKYCLMDMDLSAVPTIFQAKMIFMYRLPRSVAST